MAIPSGVIEPENSEQMQIFHQAEMSSHAKSVYTIHESNPWITSCFGRVHLSSILCSLSIVHHPENRYEIGYLTGEPHHIGKKYQHPSTSNSRPAVPSSAFQ